MRICLTIDRTLIDIIALGRRPAQIVVVETTNDLRPEHAPSAPRRALLDPPGGILMWLIVAVELFTFGMVFLAVAHLRSTEPAVFRVGQAALDGRLGLLLTATLVTSGWLTAEAVHAYRATNIARSRRYYAAALAVGLLFVGLKAYDYAAKIGAGYGLGVNDFWDAYFLATGFHFIHVLVGIVLLAYVGSRVGKAKFEDDETTVAGTALFWHMCDIAWFFLFPLFFSRI